MPKRFDGKTFDMKRDGARLTGQLERVEKALSDHAWWTLSELVDECGGSEAAVSARLRDLRKPRFGGRTVDRRYLAGGLWEYRLRK